MKFMTAFAALLSVSTSILAAPVDLTARDVWVPQIISPDATAEWHIGETYQVTWSLDQKPVNVTNPVGTVYLAKDGRLNITHPLATGFQLTDAEVSVTIPEDTIPGDEYSVVLLGDSGNYSPTFSILP